MKIKTRESLKTIKTFDRADTLAQKSKKGVSSLHNSAEQTQKEVFMWRVYAELSFKQIAQIFGKTENWACVTYHRARKMIKERLEEKK